MSTPPSCPTPPRLLARHRLHLPVRTTIAIQGALSGPLLEQYQQQLTLVRQFVAKLDEDSALARLDAAMAQVFHQTVGLAPEEAEALARLAAQLPTADRRQTQVMAVTERCALQRALASVRLGPTLKPYLAAAARGALEGFALDPSLVLSPEERAARRANIPTLPPVHHQDRSMKDAGPSPFFSPRYL